jgi:hypothetical protein
MEDFKITPREILFSVIIIALMVGLGVWISNPILESVTEDSMKVISAVKVSDAEKFGYIKRTNVGDFLAEGVLIAKDPVSISDIKGYYLLIKKVKERYTMHTRTYTTRVGKVTQVHHQVYWTWDRVHTDMFKSKYVTFLGNVFQLNNISENLHHRYIETQKESSLIRYKYYIVPTKVKGTMIGVCDKKTYMNLEFRENQTIENMVKGAEDKIEISPVVFWVVWCLFIFGCIFGFYVLENDWLED